MEGVRVLAENAIVFNQYDFVWNLGTIFCYIVATLFVIFTVALIKDGDIGAIVASVFAIFMIIVGTGIANVQGMKEVYDYTEYKVIIDDTVNMNEFMEKYEILGRDGEIYIVKEVAENE